MDETVRSKSLDEEKYHELYEKQVGNINKENGFPEYDIDGITNPMQQVNMVQPNNLSVEIKQGYVRLNELYNSISMEKKKLSEKLEKLVEDDIGEYSCEIESDKISIYTNCIYPPLFEKLNVLNIEWNILSETIEGKSKLKIVIYEFG